MSNGFTGINAFGNLTKINYKELIEKYDADKNGELSTKELQTALKKKISLTKLRFLLLILTLIIKLMNQKWQFMNKNIKCNKL